MCRFSILHFSFALIAFGTFFVGRDDLGAPHKPSAHRHERRAESSRPTVRVIQI